MRGVDLRRRSHPVHRPAAGHPDCQQRQGDVLRDRQQGRRQPGGRQTSRRRWHGDRQPHLGTPQHDDAAAADVPGQLSRANDAIAAATGVTPTLWRPPGGLTDAAVNEQAGKIRPGRNPLGCHSFRLDQRLEHRGQQARADDPDQARIGGVVARHLLQHSRSGLPVHPGAQGQQLSLGDGQPAARAASTRAASTAAARTDRRPTTCTTSRPPRFRRCPTRRRLRRCPTSRSPMSRARIQADRTTAARALVTEITPATVEPPSGGRWRARLMGRDRRVVDGL